MASGDPSARVLVLRGMDGAFSSGDDLYDCLDADGEAWLEILGGFQDLTRRVRAAPVPVIAAIDGPCVGGGFELALACDLRIATQRSIFGCLELAVGMSVTNATSVLLAAVCGAGLASELLLTGRRMLAAEAKESRFLNRLCQAEDLDEIAMSVARCIAEQAPLAVRANKELLIQATAAQVEAAMLRETLKATELYGSRDFREGLHAFRDKRAAVFVGG